MQFTVTRELPCSADAFWAIFLDSHFVTRAFGALGFPKYDVLDVRDDDAILFRRSDAQPFIDAPAVVQKVLGPRFGYVEEGQFDRVTKTWTWRAVPSVLADRSRMEGSLVVESLGADRCRTKLDAAIEWRVLGLGGLLESTCEKTMRSSWVKFGDFCEASLSAA
jgi:hypothetical protein